MSYAKKTICWVVLLAFMTGMFVNMKGASEADAADSADSYSFTGLKEGDVVKFGSYEQDDDISDGQEPIEWIVLSVDAEKALLLSKYGLDSKPYNVNDGDTKWENCTLRTWLNDDFYNKAFTDAQKEIVIETLLDNATNSYVGEDGGNDTKDKVFLVALEDIEDTVIGFYNGNSNTVRRCSPTRYAFFQGVNTSDYEYDEEDIEDFADRFETAEGNPTCCWWFRSAGVYVDFEGDVRFGDDMLSHDDYSVRPAIYVKTNPDADPSPSASPVPTEGAIKAGDRINFGSYEQDNDPENGPEPIEWIVLSVNDDKALLLSKYGLDCKPYNDIEEDVTWENCTLREWLNGEFLVSAFSDTQKAAVVETLMKNADNPWYNTEGGNYTLDKVFLLSLDDIINTDYGFSSDKSGYDVARRCAATVYAKEQGVETFLSYETADKEPTCGWWLRSPGASSDCAEHMEINGALSNNGLFSRSPDFVNYNRHAVRPAIYIDLKMVSDITPNPIPAPTPSPEIPLLKFGRYEQDNDLSNGAEPIEWIMLSFEEDRMLLLSKYVLDYKFYDDDDYHYSDEYLKERFPDGDGGIDWDAAAIPWEEWSLRNWLNTEFYNTAFNEDEKELIADTYFEDSVYSSSGEGIDADRVFLLSQRDVMNPNYIFDYNADSLSVSRRTSPTAYAKAQGVEVDTYSDYLTSDGEPVCWWWLRSPAAYLQDGAQLVWFSGEIGYNNYSDGASYGVRPAIYLDLTNALVVTVKKGDVNGDGVIDAKDVTALRRYLAGGWNVEIYSASSDVNNDGTIDAKDVTMLRRYLAGGWGVVL